MKVLNIITLLNMSRIVISGKDEKQMKYYLI